MSKRVVIIGGGVIGLSCAWYCVQRGHKVTLIDRQGPQRDGCSYGNAGMVCPSHFVPLAAPGMVKLGLKWMWNSRSPFYIKPRLSWDLLTWAFRFWRASTRAHVERASPLLRDLHMASRAGYEKLAAELGDAFELQRNGLLMLCKTHHMFDEEAHGAEVAKKLGVPAEVLDAKATSALDPTVTMDVHGSVFYPMDCHLSPNKLMSALQSRLIDAGVEFVWSGDVTGFDIENRRVKRVRTDVDAFEADEVVIACGSWSPVIGRELELKLPMQAGKGYSLTLTKPRQLPKICSIFTEARIAVTPMGATLRFGGTMEIAGLNERISPQRVQGIVDAVPKYYPAFNAGDFAGIEPWRGLRPCTPDGLPYLGRAKKYENLIVATGHAMMGLSLAPVTGELVSQMVVGETPAIDVSLQLPDRYA